MVIEAELPDGTVLEFPDGTPDEVIDRTVKSQLGVAEAPREPRPPVAAAPRRGPLPPLTSPARRPIVEREFGGLDPAVSQGTLTQRLEAQVPPVNQALQGLGTAIVKGIRDATVGAATVIPDLVGAENLSRKINAFVPEVPAKTRAQEIGAKVVEFGVPAIGATKILRAVLVAKKVLQGTGVLQTIGRMGLDAFVASGADFIAADPEEVETLGNLLGFGPTQITGKESRLAKRGKLGLEAGVAAVALQSLPLVAVAGTVSLWKLLTRFIAPLVGNKKIAQRFAADALRKAALNPKTAAAEIQKSIDKFGEEGLTTGPASRDIGLIGLEKGVVAEKRFLERKGLGQRIVGEEIEEVAGQPGQPGAAKEFFERQQESLENLRLGRVGQAEVRAATAATELDNTIAEVNRARDLGVGASSTLSDETMTELRRLTVEKNRLFDAIDPGRSVEFDLSDMDETVKAATKKRGPVDATSAKVNAIPVVTKLKKALGLIKKPKGKQAPAGFARPFELAEDTSPKLTFGDLQDARPELAAEIAKARAAREGGVVRALTAIKRGVEAETFKLADEATGAGQRAKEAVKFFSGTFAPRFRQGVGDELARAFERGKPIDASAVGQKFLKQGAGAPESADDLSRIISGLPNPAAARQATRDFTAASFARAAIDPQGKFNPAAVARFIENNQEALARFPDIRREILEFQKSFSRSGGAAANRLAQEVKTATTDLVQTQKEFQKSVLSLYVGLDAEKAIGRVLQSGNPARDMKELVRLAKQDPSGEAFRGVKASLGDWLKNRITSGTATIQDDNFVVLTSQVNNLFRSNPVRKALQQVYTPAEMGVLKRVRDRLNMFDRINLRVTSGSQTIEMREAVSKSRIILASFYGIVKGKGIFAISKWVQKLLGLDPVEKAEQAILDVLLDPPLARTMLLADTPANRRIAEIKIRSHIANNLIGQKGKEPSGNRLEQGVRSQSQILLEAIGAR